MHNKCYYIKRKTGLPIIRKIRKRKKLQNKFSLHINKILKKGNLGQELFTVIFIILLSESNFRKHLGRKRKFSVKSLVVKRIIYSFKVLKYNFVNFQRISGIFSWK